MFISPFIDNTPLHRLDDRQLADIGIVRERAYGCPYEYARAEPRDTDAPPRQRQPPSDWLAGLVRHWRAAVAVILRRPPRWGGTRL